MPALGGRHAARIDVLQHSLALQHHRNIGRCDGAAQGPGCDEASAVDIDVEVDSLCVHGDTAGAVRMAEEVRAALDAAGVAVRPFA